MAELSLRDRYRRVAEVARTNPTPEVVDLLQGLERLRRENPLQFFEPYGKQQGYLGSRAGLKAFFGGNGAGKSAIGTVDDLIQLCDRDVIPPHLLEFKRWDPPVEMRIVAPDDGVIDSTVLEKFRELTPRSQLLGGSFEKAYSASRRRLDFANGSWVLFNTSKQDRDSHAGVELRRVRFDEEPPGEHGRGLYTENVARLRKYQPDAQVCFTMTPLAGLSWTYDEVWERRDDPNVFCVVASMRDNPHIDAEATIRALSHLSETERQAVIGGEFVHLHGSVLTVKAEQVVDPPSPEHLLGQQVYIGIDPGVVRGGVVWVAADRDNHLLVFDELYPKDMTVPQIVAAIEAKNRQWGVKRPIYVMDPSGRNRSLVNADSVESAFIQHGIYPLPGQNDRRAGVMQMRARLESGSLFVSSECRNWLYEAKRWLVASDEITGQEKAKVKGEGGSFATIGPDHLMDPTRYVCMERIWWAAQTPKRGPVWTLSSGMTPPKSMVLGGKRRGSYGPLGSHG